uniref:Caspase recruitment domain-containing protein 19 n=1 Tax=Esox lucius TaxID=8010 RepID=A0AAY5KJP5_ESOLU
MGDSFHDQLLEDSRFLRADCRLDTELVDKLILQLNRIYPQILTDKEATKFRDLDVPTCVRLGELLAHLQGKGEEACREFYRALHLHVEDVYFSLPTRLRLKSESLYYCHIYTHLAHTSLSEFHNVSGLLRFLSPDSIDPLTNATPPTQQRYLLNDRGPLFFLSCFSAAVGVALMYYYGEARVTVGSRALSMASLGLGRRAREVLVWYTEDPIRK